MRKYIEKIFLHRNWRESMYNKNDLKIFVYFLKFWFIFFKCNVNCKMSNLKTFLCKRENFMLNEIL